jgi:uncharacterized membrane protein YqjE
MERNTLTDEPMGDLVKRLSEQTSELVRKELRLAQIEMQEKGKSAGKGAGLFGGAGVVALYGVGVLVAAIVLLLATALEPWVAAAIVAVVLLAVAGILALSGKKKVDEVGSPQPERAIQSAQEDVKTVKEAAKR